MICEVSIISGVFGELPVRWSVMNDIVTFLGLLDVSELDYFYIVCTLF
jgi:hypothetical protein